MGTKYPSVVPATIMGKSVTLVIHSRLWSLVPGLPSHLLRIILFTRLRDTTLDMASRPPLAVDMDAPITPMRMAAPTAKGMCMVLSSGSANPGSVSPGR